MTDPRTDLVVEAARDVLECIPGVEVMFAVGREDSFHPLAVSREGSWRVVIDGWSSSFHQAAMHTLVSPRTHEGDLTLKRDVMSQLSRLVNSQNARAGAGVKQHGLTRPYPRYIFEDDGADIAVDHLTVHSLAVMRLLAEEDGDAGAVRRRVARMANGEIRRREGLDRSPGEGVTLRHSALSFAVPLGDGRSTLDGDMLFLHQALPEIAVAAAGGWEGGPLSRLVQASGIDHLEVERIADGRIYGSDRRPHARGCSLGIQLKGGTWGPLGRMPGMAARQG